MRKCGRIRIAERAADCVGGRAHLKPLQQGYDLRVIGEHFPPLSEQYGHGRRRKDFDRIAFLQVRLTNLGGGWKSRELPCRHNRVDKGIRDWFWNFVRQRGYILEPGPKQSWRNPAGKVENPAGLGGHAICEEISMESEYATTRELSLVVDGKQERVGIHVDIDRVGGEVTGVDVIHYLIGIQSVEEQVQQFDKWIAVRCVSKEIGLYRNDGSIG